MPATTAVEPTEAWHHDRPARVVRARQPSFWVSQEPFDYRDTQRQASAPAGRCRCSGSTARVLRVSRGFCATDSRTLSCALAAVVSRQSGQRWMWTVTAVDGEIATHAANDADSPIGRLTLVG